MTCEPLKHIQNLHFPRLCGAKGEEKARDYIQSVCHAAEIGTEVQPFSVYRFPDTYLARLLVICWGLLLALSLVFLKAQPVLSLASLCIIGVSMLFLFRWNSLYEKLFDVPLGQKIHSSNVLARIAPDPGRHNIVFMAHYDSKSQMLPIYMRIAIIITGTLGAGLLAIIMLAAVIFRTELLYTLSYWGGALIGLSMLALLFNWSVDDSPGAMDNATGVAVLLELARYFKEKPPTGVNLFFLFTGAEEIGLCGAVRFLQQQEESFPRERTSVINLDGVGGREKLLVVDRYGIFPCVITSHSMGRKIKETARNRGIVLHRLPLILGALWDHVVWASHGYEAVTLSMGGWEKATFLIHSRRDTIEHINPAGLAKTHELCRSFVEQSGW